MFGPQTRTLLRFLPHRMAASGLRHNRTVEGRITVIQEERFRLAMDNGRSLLFTLGRDARLTIDQLDQLKRAGARVRVAFTGEPNEASGVATEVRPVDRL
jgi:hypothetical protein